MTPWLRTLRVTGLLLPLLAGPAFTPYAAAYEPVPAESRAGSRAGEGRERPGRVTPPPPEDTPSTHPDSAEPSRPPERPARPVDAREAADHPAHTSEPVLQVLPLGTGLILIGLGLALTFLALRSRRG
ncbi:hypothetical protein ACFU9Y_07730 [Streptomyces sp. NPDC057621]|uniref:hypothetical protein n=1 Tax=unclassified Streptomyces TaxID=2593676 RepID=UPI0036BB44E8